MYADTSTDWTPIIIGLIVGALVCGIIAAGIARSRGLPSPVAFFVFGALLGIIGIIIAAVVRAPQPAPLPPGWYADPWMQAPLRYWSGTAWTGHLHSGEPGAQQQPVS